MVQQEKIGQKRQCPLCYHHEYRTLGVRGNREHHGADPNKQPHIWTHIVNCLACDFVFTDPELVETKELEHAYYNDPITYQAVSDEFGAAMFNSRLDLIAKYIKTGNLLDIGAGKGEFLAQAKLRGWNVDGIEPSKDFCNYAAKTFAIKIRCGTIDTIDIQHEFYDVITLNHVLEHVYPPTPFLNKLFTCLKPDGILFVEVPNVQSNLTKLIDIYFRLRKRNWSCRLSPMHPPFHIYGYSKRSIAHVLNESKFKIEKIITYTGAERDNIRHESKSLEAIIRKLTFKCLNLLGNREMLCAIARKN